MRLPHESLEDLNDEAMAWRLLEPWDVHPGNARLERHAVYTFQARVAERWQDHRSFLAGDAAHLMPPFAGQGMCSGIRDAANLAWKLDLVLDGRAEPPLLATYELERRPSAEAAIDLSIELGKVICVPDPDEAAARDEAMAATVTGALADAPALPGLVHGLLHRGDLVAGEAFPQVALDGRWFDDVHGAGWRLVTDDAAHRGLDPELVGWFATIGGALVTLPDPPAELRSWFAARDVRWALQRPDFHLYGAAADLAGATALLTDLRRRLTHREAT
jgi:flavoprotein hydroxylase